MRSANVLSCGFRTSWEIETGISRARQEKLDIENSSAMF